ncbi:hypothetical protein ACOME3_006238 [Neoechinorhynchus agilis]
MACPAAKGRCHNCKRIGHFARKCRTKRMNIMEDKESEGDILDIDMVNQPNRSKNKKMEIEVRINGVRCIMQFDTGVEVSVIIEHLWQRIGRAKLPGKARIEVFWRYSDKKPGRMRCDRGVEGAKEKFDGQDGAPNHKMFVWPAMVYGIRHETTRGSARVLPERRIETHKARSYSRFS